MRYKWKTDDNGNINSGWTGMSKKEFLKLLKKNVKLIEFKEENIEQLK